MGKINIAGVAAITAMGNDTDEIFNKLINESDLNSKCECQIEIPLIIKKNSLRRMDRFSYMGLYTVAKVLEECEEELQSISKDRIGTIFSTSYGPQKTNIEFCKQVIQDDPDLCSPTLFSNTVSNACLGHICMKFKLTGVSTMLMASNNIGFSTLLLEEKKADYIVTGNIEEYCDELKNSFDKLNTLQYKIGECVAVLLLKREENIKKSSPYGELKCFADCNLGVNPFIEKLENKNIKTKILRTINRSLDNLNSSETIDAVICSGELNYLNIYEENAAKSFNSKCTIIKNIKEIFGETFGSSLNLNLIIAALCLKNNIIPKSLINGDYHKDNINNILVCGYDVSGNYTAIIVGK